MLSVVDAARPRYMVLENVAAMLGYGDGRVIQLLTRSLTEMGYQVASAKMQAGQHGVPQSRHRTIIVAAAPGHPLPAFPAPTHTFNANQISTRVALGVGVPRHNGAARLSYPAQVAFGRWGPTPAARSPSGPLPQTLLCDVFCDLPRVTNGGRLPPADVPDDAADDGHPDAAAWPKITEDTAVPYVPGATSHAARWLRAVGRSGVNCAIARKMEAVVLVRGRLVPKFPSADWRDLRNEDVSAGVGAVWGGSGACCRASDPSAPPRSPIVPGSPRSFRRPLLPQQTYMGRVFPATAYICPDWHLNLRGLPAPNGRSVDGNRGHCTCMQLPPSQRK